MKDYDFFMLSSLLATETDKRGVLLLRALGPDHYIPNDKQLSTPSSEKKKQSQQIWKTWQNTTTFPIGLLLSGPLVPRAVAGPALCYHILWIKSTAAWWNTRWAPSSYYQSPCASWCQTVNHLHTYKRQLFKIAAKAASFLDGLPRGH